MALCSPHLVQAATPIPSPDEGRMTVDKFSLFRIISFTLAAGDVLQTSPSTYRLYRKAWLNRRLSTLCFFYALARYMSIISLISNGIGFFGTHFTPESCQRFYMLPNVTAMLAGMAVQVLVFTRTWAISGRSKRVFYALGSVMLLCFPVQVFGISYHRDPFLSLGSCKGKVLHPGEPDWNIVYYSAHMAFDLIACATATTYVVLISRVEGKFNASKFLLRVLRNGLLYTLVVFLANLWVVLEFAGLFSTGAASTLPLAVVMIAAQHLILSTQRLASDYPSFRAESGLGTAPVRFYSDEDAEASATTRSDLFMLSGRPPLGERKPTNEPSHVDLESGGSIASNPSDVKALPPNS